MIIDQIIAKTQEIKDYIEECEYRIMEKEDEIKNLRTEIATLKAREEERDMELQRAREKDIQTQDQLNLVLEHLSRVANRK